MRRCEMIACAREGTETARNPETGEDEFFCPFHVDYMREVYADRAKGTQKPSASTGSAESTNEEKIEF